MSIQMKTGLWVEVASDHAKFESRRGGVMNKLNGTSP